MATKVSQTFSLMTSFPLWLDNFFSSFCPWNVSCISTKIWRLNNVLSTVSYTSCWSYLHSYLSSNIMIKHIYSWTGWLVFSRDYQKHWKYKWCLRMCDPLYKYFHLIYMTSLECIYNFPFFRWENSLRKFG